MIHAAPRPTRSFPQAQEDEHRILHVVDAEYDTGTLVAQARVRVLPTDTPDTLAAGVLQKEHSFFSETLKRIRSGELRLPAQ